MAESWRNEICQEEEIEEDSYHNIRHNIRSDRNHTLSKPDDSFELRGGVLEGEVCEQMHPLVLGLLEKSVNPAMISSHSPAKD